MAQSIIANGEAGSSVRAKLNDRWQILAQSSVGVSCGADTSEDTLATVTVPAGAMGANGRLRITTIWTITNSGNNKTFRIRFGGTSGTIFGTGTLTTIASIHDQREVCNRNSASSQIGGVNGGTGGWGTSSGANVTSAVDTSSETTVVITGQKASSGETITLESYLVELYYAP